MFILQILGLISGAFAAVIWEYLALSPYGNFKTLVPHVQREFMGKAVQFHHWVVYLMVLGLVLFWAVKTGRLLHPAIVMVVSFLLTAMVFNFLRFADWYKFLK